MAEAIGTLVGGEKFEPDREKVYASIFTFMTTDLEPTQSDAFVADASTPWIGIAQAANRGGENVQEWLSNLFTAVSGHLLARIQDVPNLRATNWDQMLDDLFMRLLEQTSETAGLILHDYSTIRR
jgi:hypothetical protein